MSNNNNNEIGAGAAIIGGGFLLLFLLLFAFGAFIAAGLTILSVFAWRSPVTIGSMTVTPEEAHGFVYRGLAGAGLLPLFAAFVAVLFGTEVDPELWFYLVVGGYVAGSLGVIVIEAMAEEEQENGTQLVLPPAPPAKPKPPMDMHRLATPPAEPAPFHFASWDDEAERRS